MTNDGRRVLIVAFDALRPDMVTPELMPNLTAFAAEGSHFVESRATFPTETRVNQAALVTGCYPSRHGIVGNKFLDPLAAPDRLFNTGDETALREGDRRLGGKLIDVPVLGEILANAGRSLAVVSAGTPGGGRMLHHKAERLGGLRLALHRPDAAVPRDRVQALFERIGPIPPLEQPANSWITYVTDAYLDFIEPRLAPDVTILWLCEPDSSYHSLGIGTPPNLAALRHADAMFGRLMAWRAGSPQGQRLQVITLSDHGQLTVTGAAVDLADGLRRAGFSVGPTLAAGPGERVDVVIALDSAGGLYVRDSDPGLIAAIVAWLQAQPWCGLIFTRDGQGHVEGTLTHRQAGIDHPRAADIGLVLKSEDDANDQGRAGRSRHDSHYPEGGGIHGGLHRLELHNWLAAGGDAFRQGFRSETRAGIIDILPTLLEVLGQAVPDRVQGRVLREALSAHGGLAAPRARHEVCTATARDSRRTALAVTWVGETRYLDRGWVEDAPVS